MLKKDKDPWNVVFKIKIWNYTKKTFSGFCQNFAQAIDELKIFFANFQILGPLKSGIGCYA